MGFDASTLAFTLCQHPPEPEFAHSSSAARRPTGPPPRRSAAAAAGDRQPPEPTLPLLPDRLNRSKVAESAAKEAAAAIEVEAVASEARRT